MWRRAVHNRGSVTGVTFLEGQPLLSFANIITAASRSFQWVPEVNTLEKKWPKRDAGQLKLLFNVRLGPQTLTYCYTKWYKCWRTRTLSVTKTLIFWKLRAEKIKREIWKRLNKKRPRVFFVKFLQSHISTHITSYISFWCFADRAFQYIFHST